MKKKTLRDHFEHLATAEQPTNIPYSNVQTTAHKTSIMFLSVFPGFFILLFV